MKSKSSVREKRRIKWPSFLIPNDELIRPKLLTRIDYLCGLLVLFISFGVYLHTLTGTIGLHDAGDMITASYLLGIPHPTGYPLYCIFGKFFITLIPIGNIAYRMNMESALFASLAVMMTYFITLKLTTETQGIDKSEILNPKQIQNLKTIHTLYTIHSIIPPIVASLSLAFSATFWEQAVIAEKYTLNAFFLSLLIFILLKWSERLKTGYLYLFAFLLGLSLTHHMQTSFIVLASISFIIATFWKYRATEAQKKKIHRLHRFSLDFNKLPSLYTIHSTLYTFLKMALLFILPLTLWAYLPMRASQHPAYNWGNPENLNRLIEYPREYKGYIIKEGRFGRLCSHITQFPKEEFTKYPVWIGIIGLLLLFVRKRTIFFLLALILLADIFYSIHYTIKNIQDYYIPSYVVLSICIGFSIYQITTISFLKYLSPAFLIIPILLFKTHYFHNDKSIYYVVYDYGVNMMRPLKEKGIVFAGEGGDSTQFTMDYLHYVENMRKDLILIDVPSLAYDWYAEEIQDRCPELKLLTFNTSGVDKNVRYNDIIHNNLKTYPIYHPFGAGGKELVAQEFSFLVPIGGNLSKMEDKDMPDERLRKVLDGSNVWINYRQNDNFFRDNETLAMIQRSSISYNNRGGHYYNIGDDDKAIKEFKKALKIDPRCCLAHNNLGLIYYAKKKMYDEALAHFRKVLEIDPAYPNLHFNLGNVYMKMDKINDAIREYKKEIEINPQNINVKEMLEEIKQQKNSL